MTTPGPAARPAPRIGAALARNWFWLLALGVLLIAVGTLAILAPVLTSVAVNTWIGVAFMVAGAAQAAHAMSAPGWAGRLAHLGIGLVYLLGGGLVVFNPLAGLMAFTMVVAAALTVSGGWRLIEGLRARPAEGWGWQTAAGGAMLTAALAIWFAFPGAALWLLGMLAGAAFIAEGWALMALGWLARKAR